MNWPADDEPVFREETLQQVTANTSLPPELLESLPTSPVIGPRRSRRHSSDPGREVLVANLCPTNPGLLQIVTSPSEHSSIDSGPMETSTEEKADGEVQPQAASSNSLQVRPIERHDSANTAPEAIAELDPKALAASATAAIATNELSPNAHVQEQEASRVHASQDAVPKSSPEQRPSRSAARSPLKLQTAPSDSGMQPPPPVPGNTITASAALAKYAMPVAQGTANTLPAVQPISPVQDRELRSPQTERLPSFRTFTGQLNELAEAAEAAAIQEPRTFAHHHSHSFGSATSQSPRLPYHTSGFPVSAQTSPVSHYAPSARSPTSTISEVPHHVYGSPQQYTTPTAYFMDRRSSAATGIAGRFPPPLLSASTSSGESHGHPGSSADGYSTSHTTPVDPAPTTDGTPRPILPPPAGMMTGFVCDEAGCTAAPFTTQYLLSSHRNVHSSTRPHFCPVEGCPRSEGNKGFKRKNEMIRHGLVHNSPGYVCPFCPDREHRYPRPDNLQRHVRVHHVDKDKDDAALREVLAQRIEGTGKQRRRRTDAKGTVT